MTVSAPPDTPADISVFFEEGKYVFRVAESKAIYLFDHDKSGTSTCTDACSQRWPPVIASKNSQPVGDWTMIERADHAKQWRYRNRPVYMYADDKPGEALGDGIEGVWHVVAP